jgi:hypothetical protein
VWTKTGYPLGNKNSIQFANLAPGTYTFKVLGSNNDGIWSEQPAELRLSFARPGGLPGGPIWRTSR